MTAEQAKTDSNAQLNSLLVGIFQWVLKRCCGVHGKTIFCQGFLKRSVGVVLSLPIIDKVPLYHIGGLQWQLHLFTLCFKVIGANGQILLGKHYAGRQVLVKEQLRGEV